MFTAALPDAAKAFLSDWKLKAGGFRIAGGRLEHVAAGKAEKLISQPRSGNRASFRRPGRYHQFDLRAVGHRPTD